DALIQMDNALIERNLSPGGSADLLSVGWVLAKLPLS
ncbi:triphosphoribosyl-dephospho-CoA synthase, partial [Escherichia coli]